MGDNGLHARSSEYAAAHLRRVYERSDRVFMYLMTLQFAAAGAVATFYAPLAWGDGAGGRLGQLGAGFGLGGVLAGVALWMAWKHAGTAVARHVIGVCQMLFSALFVHLTMGRTEAYFHVFLSLTFLSFYRDWLVVMAASGIACVDVLLRGLAWPESAFGTGSPELLRALEHVAWIACADVLIVYACLCMARDAHEIGDHQARLEETHATFEDEVHNRTEEFQKTLSALMLEMETREQLEAQLVQAQKLESIGQLAAGIAHEINTPAQYVSDNTRFIGEEFESVMRVLDQYSQLLVRDGTSRAWDDRDEAMRETLESVDFEFLREEIPQAIAQSQEGIDRISHIVKAMKDFSHPGSTHKEAADLNAAVDSTATVCSNRWKYAADLELDLDPNLPPTPCLIAEFNQVILNLIVNAADAIMEKNKGAEKKGRILVSTRLADGYAEVSVTDDGSGIPDDLREKIFDPFFTTKDVGSGTGQGLAISRDVIVQKHGGELVCESTVGQGSTFTVRLPLVNPEMAEAA